MVQMCMIQKQVKEFGKKSPRLKIDINKSDELEPGAEVVVIPIEKYNQVKQDIWDLQNELMTARNESEMMAKVNENLTDQITELRNRKIHLDKLIKNAVTPIDKHYKKELSNKDNELKRLQDKLDALERKTVQYNLDMQGLNAIDILILRKHKKLIQKYNDEITVLGVDPKIVDAEAQAIPGSDSQEQ